MKKILHAILPDAAAILAFALIAVAYFFTPLSEGLSLSGHDNTAGIGAGQERKEFNATHDEPTYWTNSLFGGMPTYQLAPSYPSTNPLFTVQRALGLWLPQLLTYVFLMLLGFYIMLRAFDFRVWMAALGAVVWAFSSYFFIIIGAGHLWKVYALAYLPALIGGIVLCLRGRILAGAFVTALFAALEVVSNHPQMTYYFIPVIAVIALCQLFGDTDTPLKTRLGRLAVAVAAGLVGVCINLTSLYHTYEYSKHTMRGGSELKTEATATTDGLDRAYITQWSYGIDETWSLLVPKINGGSSMERLDADGVAMAKANPMYSPVYQSLPQYFGDQPFTAGPVYVGAIVLMLAVIALFICRGPLKWGLLALTVLSILLSWGHNLQWFTDLFIDHVPLYSKFRTVSSILVVAEFTIPLLAVMGLREFIRSQQPVQAVTASSLVKQGWGGAALPIIAALLIALVPDLFVTRFVSAQEQHMLSQAAQAGYIPQDIVASILANLADMRRAVVSADAWRSLGFMAAALVPLVLFRFRRIGATALTAALLLLCIADMWTVNKRYLNDSMFAKPRSIEQSFAATPVDAYILQDEALDYRVLNLAADTFNENQTSYHHKSVGGYSAVKMQRYQDIIEWHLRPEMRLLGETINATAGFLDNDSIVDPAAFQVLNMLNTRWVIVGMGDGLQAPVFNPHAFGNAWFVDDIRWAADANDEIMALDDVDLRRTAVISKADKPLLDSPSQPAAANSSITLTSYEPNLLTYSTEGGGLALFSEIFYPGWTATLDDGTQLPIIRADYILRAVSIPSGRHTLTLRFDPQTIHVTEAIAWASWLLLILPLLLLLAKSLKGKGKGIRNKE